MTRSWIIAVIATAGVINFLSGCGQDAGGASPDSEPTQRTTTSATLGIDLGSCLRPNLQICLLMRWQAQPRLHWIRSPRSSVT